MVESSEQIPADALFLCFTTVASQDNANRIAQETVENGLAACVQIEASIQSHYRWDGKVHADPEIRLCLKTTGERLDALEQRIHEIHPYDTPEWVCVKAEKVSQKYLKWAAETAKLRDFS